MWNSGGSYIKSTTSHIRTRVKAYDDCICIRKDDDGREAVDKALAEAVRVITKE